MTASRPLRGPGTTRRPGSHARRCISRVAGAACWTSILATTSVAAAGGIDWRTSLDWFASFRATLPPGGVGNPENRTLRLPLLAIENELRPSLRFDYSAFQLMVRPSFALSVLSARVSRQMQDPQIDVRAQLTELYAVWKAADFLSLAYGLQNYQWGPSETLSPSNSIFHLPYTRNILTLIRGRHLARVNISPSRSWSIVVLLEPTDNGEPAFTYGAAFDPKALVKIEYTRPSGDTYVGVTAAKGEHSRAWVGEYGVFSVNDAFSIYADARHTRGSDALYPTGAASPGKAFAATEASSGKVSTIATLGARYQFKDGEDLRLEYLHNDPGYDRQQMATSARTVAASTDPAAVGAYASPGLDLPGRRYLTASVRFPKLGPRERVSLDVTYLQSLTDGTGALFVNSEWIHSDSLVFFMSAAAIPGQSDGDLTRLGRGYWIVGSRFSR